MQQLTVVPLLAYTNPNKPYILYTDAYDIACGGALVQTVHCTLYTFGKYCGTMNDEYLESKALCKVQQFHEPKKGQFLTLDHIGSPLKNQNFANRALTCFKLAQIRPRDTIS